MVPCDSSCGNHEGHPSFSYGARQATGGIAPVDIHVYHFRFLCQNIPRPQRVNLQSPIRTTIGNLMLDITKNLWRLVRFISLCIASYLGCLVIVGILSSGYGDLTANQYAVAALLWLLPLGYITTKQKKSTNPIEL